MAKKGDIMDSIVDVVEDVAEFAVKTVVNSVAKSVTKKYLGPDGIALIDEPEDKEFLSRLIAAGWKAIRD